MTGGIQMKLPFSGVRVFHAFVFTVFGLHLVGAQTVSEARQGRGGRLAPPPVLKCERDQTTSFTGSVLAYERTRKLIKLRVRTDEETTEEFTIHFPKDADPMRFFLLEGERFTRNDWSKIESRRGRIRPHMRVTVWACYRGDTPEAELLDWRPPSDDDAGTGGGRP